MNEAIDVRKEYERWLDENYLAEFPRDPIHPNKVSYSWEAYKAGIQRGRELEREELSKQEPVGYVRAYAVKCLQGTLMNDTLGIIPPPSFTRICPYQESADDIPLYAAGLGEENMPDALFLKVGACHYPPERTHIKTEIWWLIEADSPCIFMAPQNYTTTIAVDAYRFLSHRAAEAFLESQLEFWNGYVGKKDWKIVDHIFYM